MSVSDWEQSATSAFVWPGPTEEAVEHLQARDVAVVIGPVERPGAGGDGVGVYFRDPDGYRSS